jgi:hypothetical protein
MHLSCLFFSIPALSDTVPPDEAMLNKKQELGYALIKLQKNHFISMTKAELSSNIRSVSFLRVIGDF